MRAGCFLAGLAASGIDHGIDPSEMHSSWEGEPGDCEDPSCDVVEFYHQVVVLRAGMEPGWRGIGFPRTSTELERRLGPEIKAVMEDPRYHQIRGPLGFDYPVFTDD